jgi:hypothetical protein
MKKYILPAFILFGATWIQSCDYVANPNEAIGSTGGPDTNSTVHERRVLVEDYTGHKCTACPQAAIVANSLIQTYGEKVVVVGIHAGFFATPTTPSGAPTGSYKTDFRTAAGDAYDDPVYFGISGVGNPNGMINRKDYSPTTGSHVKSHTTWAAEVSALLALEPTADITITNTYNSSTRSLSTNLVSEILSDTITSGTYKLVVMITQDSIIDWQLDAGVNIPDYVHKHVLRDNINGTWGDTLVSGTVTPHSPITKNYVYTLPAAYKGNTCDENHCYVVAFIYNTANYEVLQAAEAKVK